MKIAYVSSEVTPYASTGGLAEVAGSLPEALTFLGHEVIRFTPMYRGVIEHHPEVKPAGINLVIPVGFRAYRADIWQTDAGPVRTYFVRRDEFFDRSQLYRACDRDYDDNFERFVFFQKAVVALLDHLKLKPDIVHGNDWQCGLLPYFLANGLQGTPRPAPEPFVYTFHNLAYQGIFPGSDYAQTNLPFNCFNVSTIEYYGKINCLKGGITAARAVTTVSPTYAQEIRSQEWGYGLEGLIASQGTRINGILNGIDVQLWDPSADKLITQPYSATDRAGKGSCRNAFLAHHGLKADPTTAVLAMITRLVDQKGMDLLASAISDLMKRDVVVFVHGSGETKYHELCQAWRQQWPDRFGLNLGYDAVLAHRVLSASDFLLVPSQYEPCGLSQFYGMRYGALPVAHAVGGLVDAIQDATPDGTAGTGLLFKEASAAGLLGAVDRALALRLAKEAFAAVQIRAMSQDFSWSKPAAAYAKLYADVLSGR